MFLFFFNSSVRAKEVLAEKTPKASLIQQEKAPDSPLSHSVSGIEYLIKKLDYLNKAFPESHKAKKALNLRLAHALSLIAEKNFIKHEKEKCSDCLKTAQISARRSLSIYEQLDMTLRNHPLLYTTALFKQAYLERLLGNKTSSLSLLKRITEQKNIPALLKTRAWYNIGEIFFELYDYGNSLLAFNKVLTVKSPWEFKAAYRKIWSLFNLSLYQQSISELISFLESDLYLSAKSEDRFLKKKLEGELVTLYSYAPINDQSLDFLYSFNKQNSAKNTSLERRQRLFDLAKALNRIGRLIDSNKVWMAYLSKGNNPEEQLLAYSFILDNDLVLNSKNKLGEIGGKIEKIFALQRQVDKYKEPIGKKIQQFFNQAGKKQQLNSKEKKEYLLSLYQQYHSIYPKVVDTLLAEAGLAEDLGKFMLAGELLREAVVNINNSEQKKLKENINVKQMEIAELTKDDNIRLKAYQFYIKHGANPSLIFKAKYQIAYIAYSNKEFKKAGKLFDELALSKAKERDLQLKSAHLSLSALNQLENQEEQLIYKTRLFIQQFPKDRKEFIGIYNSAVLNTVKKLVVGKDFSHRPTQPSIDKDILKAWDILQLFSVKDANKKELSNYYLNKLLLAKELLKFKQMDQSLNILLSTKGLSKEDRKTALTWKLWLAELRFNFKEVLRIVKILEPSNQSEEHLLRLARISELAGVDPVPYYKAFIKKFPNSKSGPAVLTSMIEKSFSNKEQKKLLQKYASFYKKDAQELTYLILQLDKGQLDSDFINSFLRLAFMRNTFLSAFEERRSIIDSFRKALKKMSSYSLSSQLSGSRLKFKLRKWTQAVGAFQKKANDLLKTQDWTARVFIISHYKKELERFYYSVISLSAPKGLTEEEQKEYKTLLVSQMQEYKNQIQQLDGELKLLWTRDFLTDYSIGLEKDFVYYPPLKWELTRLAESAEGEQKEKIQGLLSSLNHKLRVKKTEKILPIEPKTISGLYKTLKQNPFDQKSLFGLLNLEKRRKNTALSFYLANRIEELKKQKDGDRL